MAKRSLGLGVVSAGHAEALSGDALAKAVLADKGTALFTSKGLASGAQSIVNELNLTGDRATLGSASSGAEVYSGKLHFSASGAAWQRSAIPVPSTGFTFEIFFTSDDYTPSSALGLGGQFTTTGNERSWALQLISSGALRLYGSADGSSTFFTSSSDLLSSVVTDGEEIGVRVTPTQNGSNLDVVFSYSLDKGLTWTKLGTTMSVASQSIYSSSVPFTLGARFSTDTTPAETLIGGSIRKASLYRKADTIEYIDFGAVKDGAVSHGNFAQFGSAFGEDTNDPVIAEGLTTPSMYFPGTTGSDRADTGNSSYPYERSIACVYDYGSLGVQNAPARQYPGGFGDSANDRLFVRQNSGSTIFVGFFDDNQASNDEATASGTVPLGTRFVRVIAYVGGELSLDYSDDGKSWTTATVTIGAAISASPSPTNQRLRAGSRPYSVGVEPFNGQIVGVALEIDGAEVERVDARDNTAKSQTAWTSKYGNPITVSRSTTGNKAMWVDTGRSVIQSDGTDDYIQLPSSLTPTTQKGDQYTVLVVGRMFDSSGTLVWFSTESATNHGLIVYTGSSVGSALLGDGSPVTTATGSVTEDIVVAIGAVVDTNTVAAYRHGFGFDATPGNTSSLGALTHNAPRLFLRASAVNTAKDMDFFALAIFEGEALSEAELDAVSAYLKAIV